MKPIFITAFIILSLSSCAPKPEQLQPLVAQTIAALPTHTLLPTYTPFPTFTPYPTLTPWVITATPSSTPENLPTPVFSKWAPGQVAEVFRAMNLEAGDIRDLTLDDYGTTPKFDNGAIRFLIPSLCSECGGRIFSFNRLQDLEVVKTYFVSVGQSNPALYSWVFTNENILVQINGRLPEARARLYEAALESMN